MRNETWSGLAALWVGAVSLSGANWPSWRGPSGNQVSPETAFPMERALSSTVPSNNIRWQVELPASGNSSPIVWGDRVFLTQAVEDGANRWWPADFNGTADPMGFNNQDNSKCH